MAMSTDTMRMLVKALGEELDHAAAENPNRPPEPVPVRIGEWCRRDQAHEAFGVTPYILKRLVIEHKVIAKKFDPYDPKSVVVFRTADIRKAIEDMPNYTYGIGQ